jgi:ankyrin repeat protein
VQAILKKLHSMDKNKMSDMDKQFYINSSDANGDTALHIAAKKDYQTITDLILR